MAFDSLTLFGCTVKNFSVSLGWGTQKSSVKVVVVEDTNAGETYTPPTMGSPVRVNYYNLDFQGLFQSTSQRAGSDGLYVYEINIEDPRDILEGCEVILGAYNGSTFGTPNLLNPFGLAEIEPSTTLPGGFVTGFGASLVNESGFPWNNLMYLLELMTSNTSVMTLGFGGYLSYKGYFYTLDLSDLPIVPDYYRIPGSNINLLNCIAQLCADTGHDFYVTLIPGTFSPGTIKVVTQSRVLQPAPGILSAFVNIQTASGLCKRSSIGVECRNEVTSSFLVGGDATTIYETAYPDSPSIIHNYFGDDVNGEPIVAYSAQLTAPGAGSGVAVGAAGSATRRYKITAFDYLGETPPNSTITVTSTGDEPLCFASVDSSSQVSLSWSAVAGAVGYGVYYEWPNGGGVYRRIATTYTNSFLHDFELDRGTMIIPPNTLGISYGVAPISLGGSYTGPGGSLVDRKFVVAAQSPTAAPLPQFVGSNELTFTNTRTLDASNYIDLAWSSANDGEIDVYYIYTQIPYTGVPSSGNRINDLLVCIGTTRDVTFHIESEFTKTLLDTSLPQPPSVNTTGMYYADLNSAEIYDIIGSYTYTCSYMEMAAAMSSIDSWIDFIQVNRPSIYNYIAPGDINVLSAILTVPAHAQDMLNLKAADVADAAEANIDITDFWTQRIYNFVKKNADEYLGKKYLVEIPSVLTKVEDETGRLIYSAVPASNGYFESPNPMVIPNPLGLDSIYAYNFQNGINMYQPFVLYNNLFDADFSRMDNNDYFIGASGIYSKASISDKLVDFDGAPHVIIDISNPVYHQPDDSTGAGFDLLALVMQGQAEDLKTAVKRYAAANFNVKISPLPLKPDRVAVPLKSNILTYGPWYVAAPSGNEAKVQFNYDSSMVPWNYGGFDIMNLTGDAKVLDAVTAQMTSENGDMELVGEPLINLGDRVSVSGIYGPNLTGMDIGYGADGVTTTYRFNVFTPKFGAVPKQAIERNKANAISIQNNKRDIQTSLLNVFKPQEIFNKNVAFRSSVDMRDRPAQSRRASPHSCFTSISVRDVNRPYDDTIRSTVTTVTDSEIKRVSSADKSDEFQSTALMSLNGLLRPFTTELDSSLQMARYETPGSGYTEALDGQFLNPFKSGNDIDLYFYGKQYDDAHAYLEGGPEEARVFALRAPLVLSGWGWSTDDAFVPNASGDLTGGPLSGYLTRSQHWKTGPVDLLWDDERKVWTPHGMFAGKINEAIPAGGSTDEVDIYESPIAVITGRKKKRTVVNFFSSEIPSGTKIMAAWTPEANAWYIISADCST